MDLKKLLGDVPWITKEDYFDPGKFPIDSALKQAISDDHQEFQSGLNLPREVLAEDRSFSPKMRDKFRAVVEQRFLDDN